MINVNREKKQRYNSTFGNMMSKTPDRNQSSDKVNGINVCSESFSNNKNKDLTNECPKVQNYVQNRHRSSLSIKQQFNPPQNFNRGKSLLTQKAYEIAEKTKNNIANFWNIFVIDSGKIYTENYKVIKKIGQGGCGEVFMVMHMPTD